MAIILYSVEDSRKGFKSSFIVSVPFKISKLWPGLYFIKLFRNIRKKNVLQLLEIRKIVNMHNLEVIKFSNLKPIYLNELNIAIFDICIWSCVLIDLWPISLIRIRSKVKNNINKQYVLLCFVLNFLYNLYRENITTDIIFTFIVLDCFIKENLLFLQSKIFLDLEMLIVLQSNLGIFLKFYEIEPWS